MTVYYVFMTHGDPKLGPAGSAKHTDTTSPQAEMQIFLTLGRTKVYTEAVFSKGFPPFLSLFLLLSAHFPKYQTRQFICSDILSCDVDKITETKSRGKSDAFMWADGACTNPHHDNAICLWLAVIEQDNHPMGRCHAIIMHFVQFLKGCNQF